MELPKQFYYKKNRLNQLRGFYFIAQTGSISKAAEKMGLGQSTTTLQLQSLERDLGVKLFKRNNKTIKITKEGKTLYNYATPYVQGIDDLFKSALLKGRETRLKTIKIAANHVSISYILPKYIKEFQNDNLGTKFQIYNTSEQEGVEKLIDGKVDFFIYPMTQDGIPPGDRPIYCHF